MAMSVSYRENHSSVFGSILALSQKMDLFLENMALLETNASNEEAVDWDDLVKGRSGEICRKRWKQMVRQLGEHRSMQLFETIDLLVKRYAPELVE